MVYNTFNNKFCFERQRYIYFFKYAIFSKKTFSFFLQTKRDAVASLFIEHYQFIKLYLQNRAHCLLCAYRVF